MKLDDLISSIEELPPLPDTVVRLQELVNDKSSTIEDIGEVVSIDPSLTGKILKIANSAFYSFPGNVDTVGKALTLIGSDAVYNLALGNSVMNQFGKNYQDSINLEEFWQESVDIGLIAKEISKKVPAMKYNTERAFVMGLLLNLGKLICVKHIPNAVVNVSHEKGKPWQRQKKVLGFTYYEVTAALLQKWSLPVSIFIPIQNIGNPIAAGAYTLDSFILRLSFRVSTVMDSDSTMEEMVEEEILKFLSIQLSDVRQAVEFANMEAFNILEILSPGGSMLF